MDDGSAEIGMQHHLREAIEAFPEELGSEVSSPAASHLFEVNPNCSPLSLKLSDDYYTAL